MFYNRFFPPSRMSVCGHCDATYVLSVLTTYCIEISLNRFALNNLNVKHSSELPNRNENTHNNCMRCECGMSIFIINGGFNQFVDKLLYAVYPIQKLLCLKMSFKILNISSSVENFSCIFVTTILWPILNRTSYAPVYWYMYYSVCFVA